MNEETRPLIVSGGSDVFEITDFTVIMDSEQFIVMIENVLHEWSLGGQSPSGVKRPRSHPLPADFLNRCSWSHDSKPITYPPSREFLLTHVWPEGLPEVNKDDDKESEHTTTGIADLSLSESNFYPWSIITSQFGVFEYLLLSPVREEKDGIFTEDDLQMIQSGVEVAFANSECSLPVFIQYGTPDRIFYVGSLQNGNIRTTFETIHTHRGFLKHKCLSGLLELFKERLNDTSVQPLDIIVAIQLEYIIRNDFDFDELSSDTAFVKNMNILSLPFGTGRDVVKEFRLLTAWPGLKQEAITDTVNYSDLDPYAAPRWRASVTFHKGVNGFLFRALSKCKDMIRNEDTSTVKEIVGDQIGQKTAVDAFGSVIDGGSGMKINIVGHSLPLESSQVKEWINSIFDVKKSDRIPSPVPSPYIEFLKACEDSLKSVKSVPRDSLIDRLIKVLLNCILRMDNHRDQLIAFCQIWNAFVEHLRRFWDNNEDIPGLNNTGAPDLSKCLLYQKVQMIQCCIENRKRKHETLDATKNFTPPDEFYDANEEFMETEENPLINNDSNLEPEGRLHLANRLNLLNHPDVPIYVPITQDRSPMTEDMLEKHAEYLASIPGEDRVKAQLDTLSSDMQAFKAANPGCCLEDFVRWHSPRDYIEEEDGTGHLSDRMSMNDNVWKTTWNNAKAIAVAHQSSLFNETKEAEQIFYMFSYIKISELFKLVMPGALVTCVSRLLEESEECYSLIKHDMKSLISHIVRYTQRQHIDDCLEALNLLRKVESTITEYKSLRSKFELREEEDINEDDSDEETSPEFIADGSTLKTFVIDLMSGNAPAQAFSNASPEMVTAPVTILGAPNSPLAMSIRRLLHNDSGMELDAAERDAGINDSAELKFPPITRKHYVIRCVSSRDKGSPRAMPQRMAAFIDGDDFRVCQSLTTDLTFS